MIGFELVLGIVILLLITVTYKTVKFKVDIPKVDELVPVQKDLERLEKLMSKAIQIKTISYMDKSKIDYDKFLDFHQFLKKEFSLIHKNCEKTIINEYSLLYKWSGTKPTDKPSLYMAHMDVVPVSDADTWSEEAFSGKIKDGYVWGRGSLDTKNTLICVMESAERLMKEGLWPKEDVYFAFGHDEEIQGKNGAYEIAKHLEDNGVVLDLVVDEGGLVTLDSIDGVKDPVALIGIGEKGYLDATVTVSGDGGHAAMPPKHTAVGKISQLVTSMEKNQMSMKLSPPVAGFLQTVGPKMGLVNRIILANMWLFKPLFMSAFSKSNTGNAMLRTTTAATMTSGSNASNVLPGKASVTYNFRIALGDSIHEVVKHITANAKDMQIDIQLGEQKEPSIISPVDSVGYNKLQTAIRQVFGEILIAPYVVMAATDSVKYEKICKNIYRFAPVRLTKEEVATIHSSNERISVDNLERCLSFYMTMMKMD